MSAADKKVVFVAGAKSHGYFSHEHIAGSKLLAKHLDEAKIGLKSIVVTDNGYPKDPSVFDDAAAVVVYCDGGGRHLLNAHLKAFDKIMKRGLVWLACTMEWRFPRCSRRSFPQVDRWLLRNQLVGQSSLDGRIQGFAQSRRKLGRQAFRNKRRVVLSYALSGEHEGSNTDS